MSIASGVTAETLRKGHLRGIIGPGARFETLPDLDAALDEAIEMAERALEAELSTRFALTTFKSWMGPGAPPVDETVEYEPPYDWPPQVPGDLFPRFRTKIRPVVSLESFEIVMPGGIQTQCSIPVDWVRLDHVQGELMVAPSLFSAPLQSSGMTGPMILGMVNRQLPKAVVFKYTAGLGADGLKKWPQITRILALRASCMVLPMLSTMANPETLTSLSADGLSQSRSSGYVFKDLEERLEKESTAQMDKLLDLWDGPGAMMVL